jgi:CheY-like chemotaxis protein
MDVLLIEDNPTAKDVAVMVLERAGFRVTAVDNGLAAFAELQHHPYRVIVCDFRLPFMGGGSFFDQIKADYPQLAKRVGFVTGWAHDPETQATLEATGQPVLAKPYTAEDLIAMVKQLWSVSDHEGA